MSTVKLRKQIKDSVEAAILSHRFSAEDKALQARLKKLARDIYDDVFKPAQQKRMNDLPKGWLPERDAIRVQIGGSYERLQLPEPLRFTSETSGCTLAAYDGKHKFSEEWLSIEGEEKKLDELRFHFKKQIQSVFSRATTVNRLKELWPEIAEFLKPWEDYAPAQLPMVPIPALNTALKLPPETKKVA